PTGNLDSKTGHEIMNLFEELNQKDGVTLVIVTHEPLVANRTHRHVHIQDGEIVKEDKTPVKKREVRVK
ncbi:MAG TPA: macrolide ABC transporter ATP-binding protein, partial [Patescibacteria group bacterium]|nr:macrolide ABC transporter ATP-binding protein [Patescibacteria group bacterium]